MRPLTSIIERLRANISDWQPPPLKSARLAAETLENLAKDKRALFLHNSERCRHPLLPSVLAGRSFELRFEDPKKGLSLASIAVESAAFLNDLGLFPTPLLAEDAAGETLAFLGNAQRITGDQPAARMSLAASEAHLARGTGDPQLLSALLEFQGAMLAEDGRFRAASHLHCEATSLHEQLGDSQAAGRLQIAAGRALMLEGETAEATPLLFSGLERVASGSNRPLVLAGSLALVGVLWQEGQVARARGLLREMQPLIDSAGGDVGRLRCVWLDSRMALDSGWPYEALPGLRRAHRGFVELGFTSEVGLAALDLSVAHTGCGKLSLALRYAVQAYSTLRACGKSAEQLVALKILMSSIRANALDLAQARELCRRIEADTGLALAARGESPFPA